MNNENSPYPSKITENGLYPPKNEGSPPPSLDIFDSFPKSIVNILLMICLTFLMMKYLNIEGGRNVRCQPCLYSTIKLGLSYGSPRAETVSLELGLTETSWSCAGVNLKDFSS